MTAQEAHRKAGQLVLTCLACEARTTLAEAFDRWRSPACPECDAKLIVGVLRAVGGGTAPRTAHRTALQTSKKRQDPIPQVFAEATLAAAVVAKKPKDQRRHAQRVARLLERGEL